MTRKETNGRCRCDELERRLEEVERLAKSNRKELDIQLQRMADMQALLDSPLVERRHRNRKAVPAQFSSS